MLVGGRRLPSHHLDLQTSTHPTQVRNVSSSYPCPECEPPLQVPGLDQIYKVRPQCRARSGYGATNMVTEDALVAGGFAKTRLRFIQGLDKWTSVKSNFW